ncbi:quinone oxidoreductase family protein [Paraburkholderia phosphatilytica]|uniref:quinone oxidoreductase family protein n=1 Tax=Paraburkholderia phosphatilytica TaxID=2282883 RepID=UPI000E4ECFB4|nr:quinone oxidoreductase [Paraburkholderia phosphatilytica]
MSESFKRVVVEATGGPEAMRLADEPVRHAGGNEVRVRNEAIGVDFIDTQIRGGLLPATLPTGIGFAAVGVAEEVGDGVHHVSRGDRVAYLYFVPGSYAQERIVPAERVIRLPDPEMPADIAAGALFRGLTAWYLATRLRTIGKGDSALVHAAAGGVGLILIQWLAHLGVEVIGTASTAEKVALLREFGCPHPVLIPDEDFVEVVKGATDGQGVSVVYESIGVKTFDRSLQCAKRFGLVASYGWPSGDPGSISLMSLRNQGSLFVTRPTVSQYTADANDFRTGVEALFDLVGQGKLKIKVGNTYALHDAAQAHADLAAGKTQGSVVLIP